MKLKILFTSTTIALAGWFALASAGAFNGSALAGDQASSGYRVAQNEEHPGHEIQRGHDRDDEWYQGQRGHWTQDHNRWQWQGAQGDEWYQGQRGHWYSEPNGWQFGSDGLVCNAQGRNCRKGGYIPPNGAGMVSRNHPNAYWACDSEGHHCHWARLPR